MTITVNLNDKNTEFVQSSIDVHGLTIDELINNLINEHLENEDKPEIPNEITLAAMKAAENNEDMYGPFDSISELMEALNAET